jgi:hypothetical protein
MPYAQMTERESLVRRIFDLSDENVKRVIRYINELEEHEPNAETARALLEAEDLDKLPTYDTLEDMFSALGVEC